MENKYLEIGLFNVIINTLFFFFAEIIWAQTIDLWIENAISIDRYMLLVFIVLSGYLLSMIVSMIVAISVSKGQFNKKYVILIALLSFSINFSIYLIIAFIKTDEYINIPFPERFIYVGDILVVFSGSQPTLLWLISGVTYNIIFAILLAAIDIETLSNYKIPKKKNTKKSKRSDFR